MSNINVLKKIGLLPRIATGSTMWLYPEAWFDKSGLELASQHKPILSALIHHFENAGWAYDGVRDDLTKKGVGRVDILPHGLRYTPFRTERAGADDGGDVAKKATAIVKALPIYGGSVRRVQAGIDGWVTITMALNTIQGMALDVLWRKCMSAGLTYSLSIAMPDVPVRKGFLYLHFKQAQTTE